MDVVHQVGHAIHLRLLLRLERLLPQTEEEEKGASGGRGGGGGGRAMEGSGDGGVTAVLSASFDASSYQGFILLQPKLQQPTFDSVMMGLL